MPRTLTFVLVLAALLSSPIPAFAADSNSGDTKSEAIDAEAWKAAARAHYPVWARQDQRRPTALPALYLTLGVLNGLDLYTTSAALRRGAREANPVLGPVAGNLGAMIAVKVATTTSTIYLAERMWKRKNRKGAIILLAVANGVTAAVAASNAHNARGR